MSRGFNLVGRVFGRLTVIKYLYTAPNGKVWQLKCECGQTTKCQTGSLTNGNTRSCGCIKRELVAAKNFVHGLARRGHTVEYSAYYNARRRCTDQTDKRWNNYGGRGIQYKFKSHQD